MELNERDGAHDQQDGHLESKEKAGNLGRDGDATHHHHRGQDQEDQSPNDPRHFLETADVVVLENHLKEAADDRDHRRHGGDVAQADQDCGRHSGATTEGLANEGDEATRRGQDLGEF